MPNRAADAPDVVIQHPAADVLEVLTLENLTFRRGNLYMKIKN